MGEYFSEYDDSNLPVENGIPISKVRYLGLEDVPSYKYIENYKKFTFRTLLCRKEIIDCLTKIREECNKIKDSHNIYNLNITKPLRLQEFKQMQKSTIFQLGKKLESEWVKTIKETLEKSLNGVGKGSFNLNVASKEIYEYLKLKKYMNVVKSVMQDTLYSLVTKSTTRFVDFIESYIPEEVIINDVNDVKNHYPLIAEEVEENLNSTNDLIRMDDINTNLTLDNPIEDEEIDEKDERKPLFQINITKREDKCVEYTTKAEELIEEIMKIFDEGLEKMQQIPQVEPQLLSNLIKKAEKQIFPLKSIVRPRFGKPVPVDKDQIRNGFELNDDGIWIWEVYDRLKESLIRACAPLKDYLETFKKYTDDISLDPSDYLKLIKEDNNQNWTYQKIKEDIQRNKDREKSLLEEIPQIIHVSIFQINCKEFRTDISSKFSKIAELEIEYIKEKSNDINKEILNSYSSMKKEIMMEVETIADLVKVQSFIETVPVEIAKLRERSAEVEEIYNILDSFNVCIDHIQTEFKLNLIGGPTDIENTIRGVNTVLDRKKEILYVEQIENQVKLMEEFDILSGNVRDFENYYKDQDFREAIDLAKYVNDKIKELVNQAQIYNEREKLFMKPLTNYSMIHDLKTKFDPYFWLWSSIEKWSTKTKCWFEGNFSSLEGDDIETTILELNKDLKNSLFRLKERECNEKIIELCQKYKIEVESFKPKGDLALALTRGLQERHWKELAEKTKIDCTLRDGFTFKHILDAGMMSHLEICQEIGEKASKENAIFEQLDNIEKKWKEISFGLILHKTTRIPNVSNWNDINKELDNDIMEIQQLEVSPFKGPFGDKIASWNKELLNISCVLEEWLKCQKNWIYLQPVFDSGDIAKDIPNEHKKFMMTDRMWRDLMISVEKNVNVRLSCSREGLLEKLREANMNLETVEKGLNAYMEKKREIFPRFYFISNAQFLEILSQTKDIKMVKDNVNKIFEMVYNIELKDDKYITTIISSIGESLTFEEPILIYGKNVEIWMSKFEEQLFKTVRAYLERCLQDYGKIERKDWVSNHPGQCTMSGNQIMFTKEVEEAIQQKQLKEYLEKYDKKILELVAFAREKQTRLLGINLSNLLTIDVHNKIILQTLIKSKVEEITAFDWIMQLRYYWQPDFMGRNDCMVKSVQTDFPYGYEYVGNAEILVITPLTDKCYLTLMGALRLNLGGAPAGPAGTGKTETTKDLARSLAKLCIVYNCSEDTDHIMIGKFFKGLSFCGAWICFDEFNRINIEVLSVIATQLLQLFGAKEKGDKITVFEGSTIKILPTFCVFITMNPGYAGRTELPDNLKALFRPIAMMVPNYRLIAEINLYSAGYVQASDLATKIVSTMKLSSEQLSTQGHYDFGMRAVKSVLNAARRLKRLEGEKDEDQLLLRALEDVNVPKFIKEDIPLFRNIIKDLFPTTVRPVIDNVALMEKVGVSCVNNNIILTESFSNKVVQLYDTIQVRHGLMLVGPSGGGKTMNYKVLKEAITMLDDGSKFYKTVSSIINPKAIRHSEIYSEQDPNTLEWSFGVLPLIINECKRDTALKTKYWIIFDGPVDAMWIEDMNSVLDDSKKLCLASSDIIQLNEMITLMFEVEDLIVASPATISRCGMVFMEPSALGLGPLIECYLKKLEEIFNPSETKIISVLSKLLNLYLDDCIYFVRKRLKELAPTVDNNLAKSCMKIIDTYFDKFRTPEYKARKKNLDDFKEVEVYLEGVFNYAIVWSLGVTTNEEGRIKFNSFFRDQMKNKALDKKNNIPDEGLVYDYHYDIEKNCWITWRSMLGNFDIPIGTSYHEIIVPTADSERYTYLTKQLVKSNKHILSTGPTGTGKTINIVELITRGLTDKYLPIIINFSAQTSNYLNY
jgi:dynein heavy chain